jgi:hypothetical protein
LSEAFGTQQNEYPLLAGPNPAAITEVHVALPISRANNQKGSHETKNFSEEALTTESWSLTDGGDRTH